LSDWFERVRVIGHGNVIESGADEAIAIATANAPLEIAGPVETGYSIGQMVKIKTEQSGDDPVKGQLLRCDSSGITVRRTADRAGPLNIHFPRMGQIVIAG
jgi:hypothetical protein